MENNYTRTIYTIPEPYIDDQTPRHWYPGQVYGLPFLLPLKPQAPHFYSLNLFIFL